MNADHGVLVRLRAASDLPTLLAAACDGFEFVLSALREHENCAERIFAAFVMAAASAADGRDAVAAAAARGFRQADSPDPGDPVWLVQA